MEVFESDSNQPVIHTIDLTETKGFQKIITLVIDIILVNDLKNIFLT